MTYYDAFGARAAKMYIATNYLESGYFAASAVNVDDPTFGGILS
jgi:hypothetical protein